LIVSESDPDNGQAPPQRNGNSASMTKAELFALREQVHMLGISLGNWREAARRSGLKEDRVLQWVHRYGWTIPERSLAVHHSAIPISAASSTVIKPAEVLTQSLRERKDKSTLHLSKYVVDASERLAKSKGDLSRARQGSDVVKIRQRLWPESANNPSASLEVRWSEDESGRVQAIQARLRARLAQE
jgi:hypothetical protein